VLFFLLFVVIVLYECAPVLVQPPPLLNAMQAPSSAEGNQEPVKQQVRALYDYTGDPVKGQLTFTAGEVISLLQMHDTGWWTGELKSGQKGYFPSTFVEIIS
jgi:hypothetical protein